MFIFGCCKVQLGPETLTQTGQNSSLQVTKISSSSETTRQGKRIKLETTATFNGPETSEMLSPTKASGAELETWFRLVFVHSSAEFKTRIRISFVNQDRACVLVLVKEPMRLVGFVLVQRPNLDFIGPSEAFELAKPHVLRLHPPFPAGRSFL